MVKDQGSLGKRLFQFTMCSNLNRFVQILNIEKPYTTSSSMQQLRTTCATYGYALVYYRLWHE